MSDLKDEQFNSLRRMVSLHLIEVYQEVIMYIYSEGEREGREGRGGRGEGGEGGRGEGGEREGRGRGEGGEREERGRGEGERGGGERGEGRGRGRGERGEREEGGRDGKRGERGGGAKRWCIFWEYVRRRRGARHGTARP